MGLSKYLTPAVFDLNKDVFVKIHVGTHFGYTATAAGEPERVKGMPHVLITPHDWQAGHVNEDTAIVKVMSAAADANPLKLGGPAKVQGAFWGKFRGLQAVLMHPSMQGKFRVPLGPEVVKHEAMPEDRFVVIGTKMEAGIWVQQGFRRNVVAHNKRGLTSVQFYSV